MILLRSLCRSLLIRLSPFRCFEWYPEELFIHKLQIQSWKNHQIQIGSWRRETWICYWGSFGNQMRGNFPPFSNLCSRSSAIPSFPSFSTQRMQSDETYGFPFLRVVVSKALLLAPWTNNPVLIIPIAIIPHRYKLYTIFLLRDLVLTYSPPLPMLFISLYYVTRKTKQHKSFCVEFVFISPSLSKVGTQ